jgi:DNA topoisomerase-3
MKLYIAEKPSLGRAIAASLPKPHKKGDGYIEAANGDRVSWCIGHLLEQAEPDAYDAQYKKWSLQHLPIVPNAWKLKAKSQTRKQLSVLRALVKEADELVHAGDPDREGQLLVDEVIDFLGVSQRKKSNVKRCLINDLNPSAVTRALGQLRSNQEFIPLSVSALARSRADWLYGLNMTRAYTLKGQEAGYTGVLSVGRVQTPLLGLVVRRDLEIEAFVSRNFFEVEAKMLSPDQQPFSVKWQPSEACEPWQDEQGRVLHKPLADNVAARITEQMGEITSLIQKNKKQAPPLPYNLSSLQIDGAKAFGLIANQVLDFCQSLYEKHQLITYPRSDSRYLPAEHFAQAAGVIDSIEHNVDSLIEGCKSADVRLKSKAWNDAKVDAHHAIIPTLKKSSSSLLSKSELQIYTQISRQYLMQFHAAYEFSDTQLSVNIKGGIFTANAQTALNKGWKILIRTSKKSMQSNEHSDSQKQLPKALKKGDKVFCQQGLVISKNTQPPAPYNDATLLAAMTGISRHVKDQNIKKVLKETDGVGTEATRAGIIDLLFYRKFLQRTGKQITSTITGKSLIQSLPESASLPDMTAAWEAQLNAICQKESSYQQFMAPLQDNLHQLIHQAINLPLNSLSALKNAPGVKPAYRRKRKSSKASAK